MPRIQLLGVEAAAGGIPPDTQVSFSTTFSSGNFAQFQSCQWSGRNDSCVGYNGVDDYSAQVVALGNRAHVARFEVRDGDVPPFGGGERAEIADPAGTQVREGDELWFALDVQFPADFPTPDPNSGWFIIYQWHSLSPTGSPPLTLDVGPDDILYLANEDGSGWQWDPVGPIVRGQWVRYTVHVKASVDPLVGFGEVWQDGQIVLPQHSRRTLLDTDRHYMKCGIYRDPVNAETAVVYLDNLRISTAPPPGT